MQVPKPNAALTTLALALAVLAACRPGDLDLDREIEPGTEINLEAMSPEERQAAQPGDVVASMTRYADPQVTVYDPPPDLSRTDLGVVYIPSGPPAAPASGAGDTLGIPPGNMPAPPGGDTSSVPRPAPVPVPQPLPLDTLDGGR